MCECERERECKNERACAWEKKKREWKGERAWRGIVYRWRMKLFLRVLKHVVRPDALPERRKSARLQGGGEQIEKEGRKIVATTKKQL